MIKAYPLQWPAGWPRSGGSDRAQFKMTLSNALHDLLREIKLLGGANTIISSNLPTRLDGLPYASKCRHKTPLGDAGVAVYFNMKGRQIVVACDRYDDVGHNARAIGLTIEAMRGIERWGATGMMERAFAGFAALPAPDPEYAAAEYIDP